MIVRSCLIVLTLTFVTATARADAERSAELSDVQFAVIQTKAAAAEKPALVPVALPNGQIVDHVFKYVSVEVFANAASAAADLERVEKLLTSNGYFVIMAGTYSASPTLKNEIDYVPSAADFVAGNHYYSSYTNGDAGNFLWSTRAKAEAAMSSAVAAFAGAGYVVLDSGLQGGDSGSYWFGVTFMPPVR